MEQHPDLAVTPPQSIHISALSIPHFAAKFTFSGQGTKPSPILFLRRLPGTAVKGEICMRILVATLMASAASFIAISAANAADAVDQIPQAPVAVEEAAPAATWQGFYLGGYGSYDWGRFGGAGDRDDKLGGGAFTGYNWQSGQIVYGIEADVGYNGNENTTIEGYRGEAGANGSVRGRIGYDMNPFMIYGTAGVALQDNELKDGTSSDSNTSVGYTVGVGAEAFVTSNITARVEYRYTDFGTDRYDLDSGSVSKGFDDHSVKVGIGVKF
jgi:outer membrane immunogenic protein